MKKIIGYIGTWVFYFFGYLCSKLMNVMPVFYTLYKWFMMKSFEVQDWSKLKSPWK